MPGEFILYVADPGPVKCAACEWAQAFVKKILDACEIRLGSRMEADAAADPRLSDALAAYFFEHGSMPAEAPLLVSLRFKEVFFDSADFAEMAGEGGA